MQNEGAGPEPAAVTGDTTAPAGGRTWTLKLRPYQRPRTVRAVFELAVTVVPFALLWVAMSLALNHDMIWLYALLLLPAAGLLVRLFTIAHDCGHGSFLPRRIGNDWVGRSIGVLTMTPYDYWRRSHAIHHATCGNLDRRGIGDIDTLTVAEFRALSRWGRLKYRVYRHPVVLFGIGPFCQFILLHRLPLGFMRKGWKPWLSTMGTNGAIAVLAVLVIWGIGIVPFLLIHLPLVTLAATIGVWLFYVQHQFERTLWDEAGEWDFHDAALHGSSHYDLPAVLRWFTGNIGVHHVHHLSSRIALYRLPEVLRDHPELRTVGRITLWQSLRCMRLVLWDEEKRRLVSFREAVAS